MNPPENAPLSSRILARLFDLSLLLAIQVVVFSLAAILDGFGFSNGAVALILSCAPLPLLAFWFWQSGGRQSPGYRLAGLQLCRENGETVGIWRALGRVILLFLLFQFWFCGAFLLLLAFLDSKRRALHDQLCGTRVLSVRRAQKEWLCCGLILGICCLGSFFTAHRFVPFQAFYAASDAMANTLRGGDRVLANTLLANQMVRRGEVVLFKAPPDAFPGAEADTIFIKRAVAISGDVAEIRQGQLWVNNQKIAEPYVRRDAYGDYDLKILGGKVFSRDYENGRALPWTKNGETIADSAQKQLSGARSQPIPNGQILLLGDWRGNSNDSHVWGLAPQNLVEGRAFWLYWPPDRMRIF